MKKINTINKFIQIINKMMKYRVIGPKLNDSLTA